MPLPASCPSLNVEDTDFPSDARIEYIAGQRMSEAGVSAVDQDVLNEP
jgi:hypothetical protein